MLRNWDITVKRLNYFESGELHNSIYGEVSPLTALSVYSVPDLERIPYREAINQEYKPTEVGTSFGPTWATHWFRVEMTIPSSESWRGQEVHLVFDTNSEVMVWQNHEPMQGLTGGNGSDRRVSYALTKSARPGDRYLVYCEMACNDRQMDFKAIDPNLYFTLKTAEIRVFHRDAWDLYLDFKVVRDMATQLEGRDPNRSQQALYAANKMCNVVKMEDPTTYAAARQVAREYLSVQNPSSQHVYHAVGHCHIDCAWLWPFAETRRKCARSWASTLRLMEEYPASKFNFGCSSAQQYEWVKTDYPSLYERLKRQVANNRFIPIGGTWVEMDCNMPSGEALVRQFTEGQNFFLKEFGILCEEFWLPDTFGYAAQLPQICQGVGIKYFLTTKLSWNQVNKLPFHTFRWKSLDGSSILAHFPPGSIQSMGTVKDVLDAFTNQDLAYTGESMMLFGWGDGGGGPMAEHIELLDRLHDTAGVPKVKISSPTEFFKTVESKANVGVGEWDGELYLEKHRATYTSQAAIKRYNRKLEVLLHDCEFVNTLAAQYAKSSGFVYPRDEMHRIWKLLLLNQFHDVLPGTSIVEVTVVAHEYYRDIEASGTKLLEEAKQALIPAFFMNRSMPGLASTDQDVLVLNTLGFPRSEIVELDCVPPQCVVQVGANGKPLARVAAPAYGWEVVRAVPSQAQEYARATPLGNGDIRLENGFLTVTVTRHGNISSIVDHSAQDREVIQEEYEANVFGMFDDRPPEYDAWDVEEYIWQKSYPLRGPATAVVIEDGPLRAMVLVEIQLSETSKLTQTISLYAGTPRVDFNTTVDWNEAHKFLKVLFPLDIRAANATYEVAFGHVERPTHANTSWDQARYEVCAHRWADISEHGYGVTLMNDCKYGYSCRGGVMALSLLRAPKFPDQTCDMGTHEFKYALYPHTGTFQDADVPRHAMAFNAPLHTSAAPASLPAGHSMSFFRTDAPGAVVDTVKISEDEDNCIVLRVVECNGGRSNANLFTGPLNVVGVSECDLLERPAPQSQKSALRGQWSNGMVPITLRPFQVATFKVHLASVSTQVAATQNMMRNLVI